MTMSSTVVSTVYVSVKPIASQKKRFSTASMKFCGKFQPRSPASSGQSETDILKTSRSGSTNRKTTKIVIGAA